MKARTNIVALLLIPLLLASVAASPHITVLNRLFVDPFGFTTGSCTTWATACDLQFALSVAAGDFADDEIWVKEGTYKPTTVGDRSKSFVLQSGVSIYGGFAGTESLLSQRNWVTHITILSGDVGTVGIATDNSYHVVTGSGTNSTAVLDGFTITGGNGNGPDPNSKGGGMYNASGSPTLSRLIIKGNTATYGGGMYNGAGSNPTLSHITFSSDTAGFEGGAMYNNSSNPTLTYVIFSGGKATNGGGMFNNGSDPALMGGVTFSGGRAKDGAGMYNDNSSSPIVSSATFSGNKATNVGGAIYDETSSPTLTNVTFSGNSADRGGAIFNNAGSSPSLTHVTMRANSAATGGGGIYDYSNSNPTIFNSVLYGDIGGEIVNSSSTPAVRFSDVQGGCPTGGACIGVLSADPKLGPLQNNGGFTKTMALGAGSAAIDAANAPHCVAKDQRGVARPQGGRCDMGAYEVRAKAFASSGANDGWVLESGETTSVGGSMNSASATLRVGDDASNKQYRSVLSFNTSGIPDASTVVLARVKVKQASITGTNPFTTHGKLTLDLKKPFFGAVLGLELGDFQAAPTVSPAGSIGATLVSGWYAGRLNLASLASVNKTGPTQLRLRFTTDDNNDSNADYLSLYSGNATTTSDRPLLIVYYNP